MNEMEKGCVQCLLLFVLHLLSIQECSRNIFATVVFKEEFAKVFNRGMSSYPCCFVEV